ncbi:MAG: phosphodiester glycosidase family protein [Bacilli bacterium]
MIKKFLSLLFLIVFGFLTVGQIQIQSQSETTSLNGSSYYVDHVKEENLLQYGVLQHTDIAYAMAGTNPITGAANCKSAAAGSGGGGSCNLDQFYPEQVNVLEVPSTTDVQIVPWSKMGQANWNLATVKNMATNYEQLNPGYKVIAAINGDFFDINSNRLFPKTPTGVHVSNGEYYKSNPLNEQAISFTNDGSNNTLLYSGSIPTRTAMPLLAIYNEDNEIIKEFSIQQVNTAPGVGEIALYYANWALEAGWSSQKIVPIQVENAYIIDNATYALPIATNDFYGLGKISSIGSAELNSGDFALVSNNAEINEYLQAGVQVRCQYEFTGTLAGATNAMGINETLLQDNVYVGANTDRHPRTMVGVRADGTIVMCVVDGRQPAELMYGATSSEMATILKHYGCVDGYNFDGGGSSTMIILDDGDFRVMNSPSDGSERSDGNCLLIVAKVPTIETTVAVQTEQITINTTIIDQKGLPFTDLYIELNNQMKKVESGSVTFTNLIPNTNYSYKFYGYFDGVYQDLVLEDYTFTSKRLPIISLVKVIKEDEDLFVFVDIADPDGAVLRRSVQIGDQNIIISKGQAVFEGFTEQSILNLVLNLSYDCNDGLGRIDTVVINCPLECSISFIMDSILYGVQEQVKNIYQ